jgi:hypothetical protein
VNLQWSRTKLDTHEIQELNCGSVNAALRVPANRDLERDDEPAIWCVGGAHVSLVNLEGALCNREAEPGSIVVRR